MSNHLLVRVDGDLRRTQGAIDLLPLREHALLLIAREVHGSRILIVLSRRRRLIGLQRGLAIGVVMVEQLVNYRRGHDREGCRCSVFPSFLNHRWELRGAGRRLNSEEGPYSRSEWPRFITFNRWASDPETDGGVTWQKELVEMSLEAD